MNTRVDLAQRLVDVLRIGDDCFARRQRAQRIVETLLAGQSGAGRPVHFQLVRGLYRLPLLLRDDSHEILLHDNLDETRNVADRALVNAHHRGAHRSGPHDPPVQHPRHAHVVHELEPPGRHGHHVGARRRRTEHLPLTRRLSLRALAQRKVELPSRHQVAVGDPLRRIGSDTDHAVRHHQLISGDAQTLRRQPHQRVACGRPGQRQTLLVEVDWRRLAARSRPLIGRERGVGLNEPHARERHGKLFGDELHLRRVDALAELDFAGMCRHHPVRAHGDPGVELLRVDRLDARAELSLRECQAVDWRRAVGDDERARASQEVPAGEPRPIQCASSLWRDSHANVSW